MRWEQRSADYADTRANAFSPDDDMLGGELAFDWQLAERRSAYVRLARGYKAGGFNVSLAGVDFGTVDNVVLSPANIEFDAESLTSLEAGLRASSADGRLRADVGVFVARRDDQQIKVPLQLRLGDPSSFLFVTANSERGEHTASKQPSTGRRRSASTLSAAVGWLRAEIDEFSLFPELAGREQAHAPRVHVLARRDVRAAVGLVGAPRSDRHGRVLLRLRPRPGLEGRTGSRTSASAATGTRGASSSGRATLLDEDYFVRGFYFGNEPPDFPPTLYTRLGDPRHYGITLSYRL